MGGFPSHLACIREERLHMSMNDEVTRVRQHLEAAGFRPTGKDMERFEQMRLRRQPLPIPAEGTEPWALPLTRRWRHA